MIVHDLHDDLLPVLRARRDGVHQRHFAKHRRRVGGKLHTIRCVVLAPELHHDIIRRGEPAVFVEVDERIIPSRGGNVAQEEGRRGHSHDVACFLEAVQNPASVQAGAPIGALRVPLRIKETKLRIPGLFEDLAARLEELLVPVRVHRVTIRIVVLVGRNERDARHTGPDVFIPAEAVSASPRAARNDVDRGVHRLHARDQFVADRDVLIDRRVLRMHLIIDLPEFDAVGFRVAVFRTDGAPLRVGRTVAVLDPVHSFLQVDLLAGFAGPLPLLRSDVHHHDRLGSNRTAKGHEFIDSERVHVPVVPKFHGKTAAVILRADPILPAVSGGVAPARPTNHGRLDVPNRAEEIRTQTARFFLPAARHDGYLVQIDLRGRLDLEKDQILGGRDGE